jgi:hypothetical protein
MHREANVEGACDMRRMVDSVIVVVGTEMTRREATW